MVNLFRRDFHSWSLCRCVWSKNSDPPWMGTTSISCLVKTNRFTLLSFTIWAATWQNKQSDCAPSEDLDQPGHPPSLIRVFAVRMKKAWVLSYPLSAQRRLWSDWADAQADLSLLWAHSHFVGFVMSWLIWVSSRENMYSVVCHQVRLKPAFSATETS